MLMKTIDNAILGSIHQKVRLETLRELHNTLLPAAIMGSILCIAAIMRLLQSRNLFDLGLAILAIVAALARLVVIRVGCERLNQAQVGAALLDRTDRVFSSFYLFFAFLLGVFVARLFLSGLRPDYPLAVAMAVGYCSGVALHVGLKPWLATGAMLAAAGPLACAFLLVGNVPDRMTGGVLIALLVGGVSGVHRHARFASRQIGSSLSWQFVSWRDPLTGLWNRRALEGWAQEELASRSGQKAAAHVIDLDHFKSVNDTFGHQSGDDLLCQVASQLVSCVRADDLVIRLGGDEFLVLQFHAVSQEDMHRFAGRLRQCVPHEVTIAGVSVQLGMTTGSTLFTIGETSIQEIVSQSDKALYARRHYDRDGKPFLGAAQLYGRGEAAAENRA